MGILCDTSQNFILDFNEPIQYQNDCFRCQNMKLYKHKIDSKFQILYGIIPNSDNQAIEFLKNRSQYANSLLIHQWFIKQDQLLIYFDYPESLYEMTNNFSLRELWTMINDILTIFEILEDLKTYYTSVNPKGIFRVYTLKQKYSFKIADSFLFNSIYMKYYQSPNKYFQIEKQSYGTDLFAFGLVCLYCLGIKNPKIFYKETYFDFQLLYQTIQDMLLPDYLKKFLKEIFIEDDQLRPTSKQLRKIVLNLNEEFNIEIDNCELILYNDSYQQQIVNKSQQKTFFILDGDDIEVFNEDAPNDSNYQDLSTWNYFRGRIFQGQKCGKGKLLFKNGNTFLGSFVNDKANGDGLYCFGDNEIVGVWKDDLFIKRSNK